MKKIYYALVMALVGIHTVHGVWRIYEAHETITTPSHDTRVFSYHLEDTVDYVNGGITFTYPVGIFTTLPDVTMTIQLKNAIYSTGLSFVPIITAHSLTEITVRVSLVSQVSVIEAATDSVSVHITVFGN